MNTLNNVSSEEKLSPRKRIIEELWFNKHTNFNRVSVLKVLSTLLKEKETEKNRIIDHASQILSKEGASQIISEANNRISELSEELEEIRILLEELESHPNQESINQKILDILDSEK